MKFAELNCNVMIKKNKIRFAEAFAMLPILTLSIPVPGNIVNSPSVNNAPQIVSLQQNIAFSNFFAKKEEVVVDKEAEVRKLRAEAIDNFYAGRKAPLEGYGMKMVLESEKNDLDWRLLAAISIIESNGGLQSCKKADNSDLGWGSCKINFESREKGIEIVAWNLAGLNPKTKIYYYGKTLEQKLKSYNSVIPTYTKKIYKVMDMIGPIDLGEEVTKIEA